MVKFKTVEDIKDQGFEGFVLISDLLRNPSIIPYKSGVYMVLYTGEITPTFINPGTGGFFDNRNPNVPQSLLLQNWVIGTVVLYIGKAGGSGIKTSLSKRIKQYLRFGQGGAIGHYGGRLIWQIKNSGNLLVCWKTELTMEPINYEAELINTFVDQYSSRPFANLVG